MRTRFLDFSSFTTSVFYPHSHKNSVCFASFQFTTMFFLIASYRCARYLITVGIISAVKRMLREAAAWEANRPTTEKTVMAISLRSKGHTKTGTLMKWQSFSTYHDPTLIRG